MIILDVVIHGATMAAEDGAKPGGGVVGITTAKVRWEGDWVTDGDAAAITSQRNEIAALFPGIRITDMSITPEPAA